MDQHRPSRAAPLTSIRTWVRSIVRKVGAVRLVSWLGLIALLVLVACFSVDAGVVYDEEFQREYGDRILAWYRSGFKNDRAMRYRDMYLYGGLFDVCAQWLVKRSPLGPYETRHVLTALLALLGVTSTASMAARVGSAWAGVLAGTVLALTPTWIGHGLFNPKDIPFAVGVLLATSAATRIALGPALPTWGAAAWAGASAGLALAVRPGGVFLLGYPAVAIVGRALLELARRKRADEPLGLGRMIGALAARGALLLTLTWLVMLSAWPWAQLSPLRHPIEAMTAATRFAWTGDVLFAGQLVDSHDLPRSYLPIWFGVTLPEIYQVALACALIGVTTRLVRRQWPKPERLLALGIIVLSVLLPLTAVWVMRPVIYDGHRHFIFLFPPLAALAGIALADVLGNASRPIWLRATTGTTFALLALWVGYDMVKLHPYEYVYFNRSSGGLRNADGRYELDYWGASYKEGLQWVLEKVQPPPSGRRLRVSSCDHHTDERLRYYVERWPGASERMEVVRDFDRADVFLAVTRDNCHKVPGKVLHRVRRQRVPLLYVIRANHG